MQLFFSPTLVKFLYSECCSVMKNLQRLMQEYLISGVLFLIPLRFY